jgi:iron(III) transport system substrate-binding protein
VNAYRCLLFALALSCAGCEFHVGPLQTQTPAGGAANHDDAPQGEVWVYTSIYQSVIEQLDELLEAQHPGVEVKWYRAGSEKVATRLDTELRAGGTQADLVLTSDPFWYLKLKKEGRTRPYVTKDLLTIPRAFVDADGHYATCRVSTMVIAYHPKYIGKEEVPTSFRALTEDRYAGKVTLGDPLSSGTHFTTTAFLSTKYGWDFYEKLRAGGAAASGGNSSVLRRIEGGEYPFGVVLLENVLAARKKGSPVEYLIPRDGAITIPGNIAILSGSNNLPATQAVYDVIMSPAGQRAMVLGNMHSANSQIPAPEGAPPFETLLQGSFVWTPSFIEKIQRTSPEIKSRFDEVMNR